MKTFTCDACGPIPWVVFDGYQFAEKTLEGVMFKATVVGNKIVVDTVNEWYDSPYLRGLNRTLRMKQALAFARDNDIAQCPKCGADVDAQPI